MSELEIAVMVAAPERKEGPAAQEPARPLLFGLCLSLPFADTPTGALLVPPVEVVRISEA
jgi:hypothetical protein